MKLAALGFENPFPFKHCVPLAMTAVQRRPTTEFLLSLVESARAVPHPVFFELPLLRHDGGAPNARLSIQSWTALAGLKVTETFEPTVVYTAVDSGFRSGYGDRVYRAVARGRPTVRQFQRGHRRGRWIVFTDRHALAMVNGKLRGWFGARSRVLAAFRVESIDPKHSSSRKVK